MNTDCAAGTAMSHAGNTNPAGGTGSYYPTSGECYDFCVSRGRSMGFAYNWGNGRPTGCWTHSPGSGTCYFNTALPGAAVSHSAPICSSPGTGPFPSWGPCGGPAYVYVTDFGSNTAGTMAAYTNKCAAHGKAPLTCSHPSTGTSYSSTAPANPRDHAVAAGNSFRQTHPAFSGANALILHGASDGCWAHDTVNPGAMWAWGGGVPAAGSLYSYCRGTTAQREKRFHVYVCQ